MDAEEVRDDEIDAQEGESGAEDAPQPEQRAEEPVDVDHVVQQRLQEMMPDIQRRADMSAAERATKFLSTPDGQKWYAENFGQKQDEELDFDKLPGTLGELKRELATLRQELAGTKQQAISAAQMSAAQQFAEDWEREFDQASRDIPELQNPKIQRLLRESVLADIEANPSLGGPGGVRKMAKTWWGKYSEGARAYMDMQRRHRETRASAAASIPDREFDKLPDDEQERLAREQALAMIRAS